MVIIDKMTEIITGILLFVLLFDFISRPPPPAKAASAVITESCLAFAGKHRASGLS